MFRILTLFLIITFATVSLAEDINIYEAEVSIDATAANAALARESAMKEANRKALYTITNRISAAASTDILDNLNDNQILNFIREVSVISENVTDSRYIATLKIGINAPILKAYLSEKNAPVAIMPKSHITIVPIYYEKPATKPLLWEDNNPWYQAWAENTMETGQITMSPIPHNQENINTLSAEAATSLDQISLEKILRYSSGNEIYVAEVTILPSETKAILKSPKSGTITEKTYTTTTNTFEQIINDMKSSILKQIQQQTLSKEVSQKQMTVVFNYRNLHEWLSLQKHLKNVSTISKITIDAIAKNSIQISLDYTGETSNLQDSLNKQGYTLTDKGNFYTMERIQ